MASLINIKPYLFGNQSAATTTKTATAATGSNATKSTTGWFGSNTSRTTGTAGTAGIAGWMPSGLGNTLGAGGGWLDSAKRIATYLFSVLIVLFVLLLLVHFFIKPVFRWKPGSPGWIPMPGTDDASWFWKKGDTVVLPASALPIRNQFSDYTLQVDIGIQDPLSFSNRPRILFHRGEERPATPTGTTLLSLLGSYNLAVALDSTVNDMIVSVLDKNNSSQQIIVKNVPVQQPFRLTVVVMNNAMEVYFNGRLVKTRTFTAPPKDQKGDLFPATGTDANLAKLMNLKLWSRMITTPEIRDSTPPLPTADEMKLGQMSSSSACGNDL